MFKPLLRLPYWNNYFPHYKMLYMTDLFKNVNDFFSKCSIDMICYFLINSINGDVFDFNNVSVF